jgi:hypothetical protein
MVCAPVQLYQRYTRMIMLIPGHSKHHVYLSYSFRSLPYDKSTSLFQSEVSKECELVPRRSISSILSFPKVHPVASYVSFLVFPSILSFLQKAVLRQDMTNPVGLTSVCCLSDTFRLLDSSQYFFTAHTVGPNYLLHPCSSTTQPPTQWVPGSFPGVKRPVCAVDRPPTPSSAEVKEGVEVHLYSPSVPSLQFIE